MGRKIVSQLISLTKWLWAYRLELTIGFVLISLVWSVNGVPIWISMLAWVVVIGSGVYFFDHVNRVLNGARTRRKLVRAAGDAGFPGLRVERVAATLPGELISVRVPRGQTVEKLERSKDAIAACLRVADVRVIRDRDDRSHAEISIIRRDTFAHNGGTPWPLIDATETNVREPMPLGLDEYGRMVNARLLSRNIIVGGAPDAGKSATLRLFAANAALDPRARLWMMDGKGAGVEFSCWDSAASKIVYGRDLEAAVELLAKLTERVQRRYQEILARGEVFVGEDMEIDVLMIDEVPQFTRPRSDDSKANATAVKAIHSGLWELISLGRAAGMITILSAQKPTADILPSETRDLIDHKFALHCNTKAMSDAILGAGAGEESPANAAEIPSGQPGVGYYVGDHGAQKIKAFFLSHKQALEIASRSAARQLDNELKTLA